MPGPNLAVAQTAALCHRQLQDLRQVGGDGSGQREGGSCAVLSDEGLSDLGKGEAMVLQDLAGLGSGMMEKTQEEVLASHMGMAQALGKKSGRGQTGPGLAGEGHGLDGDPSSLGCAGSGMTDLCRFSWVRVEGAPSKLGVMLPGISGDWLGFSMVSDRLSGAKNHNIWGVLSCLDCYAVCISLTFVCCSGFLFFGRNPIRDSSILSKICEIIRKNL